MCAIERGCERVGENASDIDPLFDCLNSEKRMLTDAGVDEWGIDTEWEYMNVYELTEGFALNEG